MVSSHENKLKLIGDLFTICLLNKKYNLVQFWVGLAALFGLPIANGSHDFFFIFLGYDQKFLS